MRCTSECLGYGEPERSTPALLIPVPHSPGLVYCGRHYRIFHRDTKTPAAAKDGHDFGLYFDEEELWETPSGNKIRGNIVSRRIGEEFRPTPVN